ncbi:hypothetical protein ADK70_12780 [Streptomyces rimosus subsp. pseudoverticillatus]|uniref:hypothetical protein n=1 Tax=Streptomyces rimosus TaxID=1927 RepID=UPI0006B2A913|nr:hypothetical protein [Streptomyces rimosus]KOT94537.1 hypothetical protein ADK70_12780 [Streptomyces rimosus subsp. pseudoverticillatus]
MPNQHYLKYHTPKRPDDPNAEYLTVQETAFIFMCSVPHIRRALKTLKAGRKHGYRIAVSREDRAALARYFRRTAPKTGDPRRTPTAA